MRRSPPDESCVARSGSAADRLAERRASNRTRSLAHGLSRSATTASAYAIPAPAAHQASHSTVEQRTARRGRKGRKEQWPSVEGGERLNAAVIDGWQARRQGRWKSMHARGRRTHARMRACDTRTNERPVCSSPVGGHSGPRSTRASGGQTHSDPASARRGRQAASLTTRTANKCAFRNKKRVTAGVVRRG